MKKIQNNMKEVGLAFIMGLIVAVGFIASAGCFNWAVTEGWLYWVAGALNIGVTVFAAISFYRKYLKPDEKPMTISEYNESLKQDK